MLISTKKYPLGMMSLPLKRLDAIGDRDPALRTLHPDEQVGPEPARVIKSAGFDGSHVRCGLQNVIDADAALGAEHARDLVATVRGTRKFLRRPGHCQTFFTGMDIPKALADWR